MYSKEKTYVDVWFKVESTYNKSWQNNHKTNEHIKLLFSLNATFIVTHDIHFFSINFIVEWRTKEKNPGFYGAISYLCLKAKKTNGHGQNEKQN